MISDLDRRLIVVSNRAPYSFQKGDTVTPAKSVGGLVTALEPAIISRHGAWIAWEPTLKPRQTGRVIDLPPGEKKYRFHPVPLSKEEIAGFYYGFSNAVLWPLCHYFTENLNIQIPQRRAYARVNNRFADITLQIAKPDDFIWIQDYQLGLVPGGIRQKMPETRVGLFWHIPFPNIDVFNILPGARGMLEAMLGADRIGFHVPTYVNNFFESIQDLTSFKVDTTRGLVDVKGRKVQVGAWPISVDYNSIVKNTASEAIAEQTRQAKESLSADKIILGVDRLDYTKGILERLQALDLLLTKKPGFRGKVSFIQIAAPSRGQVDSYQELKAQIEGEVGKINGKYAHLGWTPVHYFFKAFTFEELLPLYRIADVALVTPLFDGMNLVAKEYVTTRTDDTGVLVLSRRTGAAKELKEAVHVNPYDIEGMTEALVYSLTMSKREQRRRMQSLRKRVKNWDIFRWVDAFLSGKPAEFD